MKKVKRFQKQLRHTLFHPGDGFTDFMEHKQRHGGFVFLVVVSLFLVQIIQRQLTGFHFNNNRLEELNVFFILIQGVGVFILWISCNWAISTLFEGKARLRDIAFFSAVALVPYILSMLVSTVLSNVLLPTESMFMTITQWVGILWSLFLLVRGMMIYHDYTFQKVLWSGLLSIGLILVIVFVCVLGFSLFQQVFNFGDAVFKELIYRV